MNLNLIALHLQDTHPDLPCLYNQDLLLSANNLLKPVLMLKLVKFMELLPKTTRKKALMEAEIDSKAAHKKALLEAEVGAEAAQKKAEVEAASSWTSRMFRSNSRKSMVHYSGEDELDSDRWAEGRNWLALVTADTQDSVWWHADGEQVLTGGRQVLVVSSLAVGKAEAVSGKLGQELA